MRVGVVTPWDIADERAWSGVVKPMVEALGRRMEIIPFLTHDVADAALDRALCRLLDGRGGRRYLVGHSLATGLTRARLLERRLKRDPVDVVLGVAASQDLALARIEAAVVQVADTSFSALQDFYPLYTNLHGLTRWQGRRLAGRASRRAVHTLAATEWARQAIIRDETVAPSTISVARFGPAIAPGEPFDRAGLTGPARLLVVASDWERKGGDRAVALWQALVARGVAASLTVVGAAPETLPPGVRRVGKVNREEMAELYRTHHVLVELARGNTAGVTLTDAAAFGLPVLAADVGGVGSIVADGLTGRLVAGADQPAALAAVLELLDPSAWSRWSAAALGRSRSLLNWDHWAGEAEAQLVNAA